MPWRWCWVPDPPFVSRSLGNCHVGLTRRHGQWFVDAGIQYWTLFDLDVSDADALRILDRYQRVRRELAEGAPGGVRSGNSDG
jgi:hypothetical protein